MFKIGLVGYGGMGKWHTRKIAEAYNNGYADILVKGIYDIEPKRNEEALEAGLYVYSSLEELANDEEIKAVLIATPNDCHLPICEVVANAKKHVLSEKPISLSVKDTLRMYEVCEKNGVELGVHQNRRFDKDYLTVCEIIKSGVIGHVYRIESTVAGSNGIPGEWRKEKLKGGGMMLDWGVHLIDQWNIFYGTPKRVSTRYSFIYGEEVEDGFDTILDYDDKEIRINVDTSCFVKRPRWTVFGTEGTAQIEDWNLNGGITKVLIRHDDKLKGINAGNGMTKTMATRRDETVLKLPLPEVKVPEYVYYKNLENVIKGIEKPLTKKEEVLAVMLIMEKAKESSEDNGNSKKIKGE